MDTSSMGFGVTGTLDWEIIRALAPQVEAAGFRTLWINDTPGGDSLASLAVAASVTKTLQLASGVVPLDRRAPKEIIASIQELGLPQDRLILGVGSGGAQPALKLVEDGVHDLQDELACRIVVGALGPRMRQLGAVESSGLLVNWLTPDAARLVRQEMVDDSRAAGKMATTVTLYVRVALGEQATARLKSEAARYGSIAGYAANFKRLNINGVEASVFGPDPETLRQGLAAFEGTMDEIVVRAITAHDTLEEYQGLLAAIAG